MIELLIIECAFMATALISILAIRNQPLLNRVAHSFIIGGMIAGLTFTIRAFFLGYTSEIILFSHSMLGNISFRFDKLSLFFLGIIQIGGIVSSLYGIGYLSHYETKRTLKPTIAATAVLFFSMQALAAANHVFLFLVAWELMALSGYLGIVLEREDKNVQRGSFIFFVATHVGTLFLYSMFLILHQQTNSWEFSIFANHTYLPSVVAIIFWLGFIGFGMKAGFMPFHFWLPEAHPVAPSHISAVLSAVMLKTGIYGLLRVMLWTNPSDYLVPSTLLTISILSAIFGIWNALAQKDLKRMLAYSSIENIGIIGVALSLMMFGMQYHRPVLIFLGLSGALFHALNHFVFKSLLFMGAGTIYHHYHHRDIERMGGLMNSAPLLGSIMLIGSVAICGLPPLNGFASEFILYSGFFESAHTLQEYFPFFMLIAAVALAFVGGLAVIAFSKVLAMIFLGSPKISAAKKFEFSLYEKISLSLLTVLILVLGLFPHIIVFLTENIFYELFPTMQLPAQQSSIGAIQSIGMIAIASFVLIGVVIAVKRKFVGLRSTRVSIPWGCGYNNLNARMQYTGTSFSDEIVNIAGNALFVEKEIRLPEKALPKKSSFRTSEGDYVLHRFILPFHAGLSWFIDLFKWLQSGKIQVYVTFSIVVLVFYIFLAFQL